MSFTAVLPFVKELPYIEPNLLLQAAAHEFGCCFLDSARIQGSQGRYSYLVHKPFLTITSKHRDTFINQDKVSGNPFDVVNAQLIRYQAPLIEELPPFQGGAVGYFGYGLLHHLEDIPRAVQEVIDIPDLMLGFYDGVLAFDVLEKRAWVISHGFPKQEKNARQQHAIQRAQELITCFYAASHATAKEKKHKKFAKSTSSIQSSFTPGNYFSAIEKTVDYIHAGDIFQANITQCFSGALPDEVTAATLYAQLRQTNPAPFAAFLNWGEFCIASASPERFLKLDQGRVETRPIKGTRARGENEAQDKQFQHELLRSEKDRAENTMIVDLMRNDLSRVCQANSIHVTQWCGLESYATVHHLVSVVEGILQDDLGPIDLLKATFPGGSITGAPKIRAMEIIHELEPVARGVYCGSIGYIGFDGSMDTSIVIRTYVIKDRVVYFQAGGGIVADSEPQSEYEESLTKAWALRRLLTEEWRPDDFTD